MPEAFSTDIWLFRYRIMLGKSFWSQEIHYILVQDEMMSSG